MEDLITFFQSYGLPITIIAVVGIMILGILKYCNAFSKLEEKVRHYIYMIISAGVSIIGSLIYLAIIKQFTVGYIFTIAGAIWALNQTFYAIFKVTPINELFVKILDFIKNYIITSGKKSTTSNKDSEEK